MRNGAKAKGMPIIVVAAALFFGALTLAPLFAQEGPLAGTIAGTPPAGASEKGKGILKLDGEYWRGFLLDPVEMARHHAKWGERQWLGLGLFSATALGLYHYDEHLQHWSQEHKSGGSDSAARAVKPLGNGYISVPFLAAYYVIGRGFKNEKAQETGRLGFESFVLTAAATQLLKFVSHRDRPNESLDSGTWNGPSFSNHHLSFPSGDASSAFAVATIFATEYKEKRWVPPLAYGLAALTAMARVHDNAHWSSDVFAGSSLGYLISKSLYRIHHSNARGEMVLLPIIGQGRRGLEVAWRF